jgi:hypothetical protein
MEELNQGCDDWIGPRSVRPSLVTETAVRSSALIIAGIVPANLWRLTIRLSKTVIQKHIRRFECMGWMDRLFAPRLDHRGWSTPSEASRIFLILTLVSVGYWAWGAASDNLVMWFGLTILVSTPLLSIGWYLLSLMARNRDVQLLTPKVRAALESKGRLPNQFKNP